MASRHPSIRVINDALLDFFELQCRLKNFRSSNERQLAPFLFVFLCGRFGPNQVFKEEKVQDNRRNSGGGRIDFRVGDTAIELAVRSETGKSKNLGCKENQSEIGKLLGFRRKAILVLFDFNAVPCLDRSALNLFRNLT